MTATTRRARIYIAGPFRHPNVGVNVNLAIKYANVFLAYGYAPYVPHLNILWHIATPMKDDVWLALDLEFLNACDALFRIPGKSEGADAEEARARELHIPVYYDAWELKRHIPSVM